MMRATSVMMSAVLVLCCCGGAVGFVMPSAGARGGVADARERRGAAAVVAPASRPGSLPRLYSSKGPPQPGTGPDIMDSLAGPARELSTEEKIAALQREVAAQAASANEVLEGQEGGEDVATAEVAEPVTPAAAEEEDADSQDSGDGEFVAPQDFVDEGKNILWPNPRRAAQLTLLAVAAQIAFIVYIISLNSFLNSFPTWFGAFVETIKSGNVQLPSL